MGRPPLVNPTSVSDHMEEFPSPIQANCGAKKAALVGVFG